MTDHAFEQDLRAAFRVAVDEEAPASLRASVLAIPDAVPALNQRRSSANRPLPLGIGWCRSASRRQPRSWRWSSA